MFAAHCRAGMVLSIFRIVTGLLMLQFGVRAN